MKLIAGLAAALTVFAVACGGDDDANNGGANDNTVIIPAADADRVAHEALPTVEDLPGEGWQIVGEDEFSDDSGDDFQAMLEGTPECEELENLATLGSIFGDAEEEAEDDFVGRAQVELEQQDPDAFIPTAVDVEIEIKESAAGSRAQFTVVRDLLESDSTSQCLVTVLNRQFMETGPSGLSLEVSQGTPSAQAPHDGARMAFDVDMAIAGLEIDLAMQMYFWPYGNAAVEVMFMGTNETLTDALIQDVLTTVDEKLQAAATQE